MAANQPVQQRGQEHPDNFELEFNQEIRTAVFRKGREDCPIGTLRRERFMRESEYIR